MPGQNSKRKHSDKEAQTAPTAGKRRRQEVAETRSSSLRTYPRADRLFWKHSISEQIGQVVHDKNNRSLMRQLPKNEVLVLALNEVAAERGRGWFLHLPNRDTWKQATSASLLPTSRVPPIPGSRYPDIIMMDLVWDDHLKRQFSDATHRGRYLKSNAMFSRLPSATPLYAIQYATWLNAPIYRTVPSSVIIFATSLPSFVAVTTDNLELKNTRTRGGPEPEKRLLWPSQVWHDPAQWDHKDCHFSNVDQLYDHLVATRQRIASTFTAGELRKSILPQPTPDSAEGLALGQQSRAQAPSRMGTTYMTKVKAGNDKKGGNFKGTQSEKTEVCTDAGSTTSQYNQDEDDEEIKSEQPRFEDKSVKNWMPKQQHMSQP